ncbi:MAG: hypothetical protein ABEJ91_02485 [Candidatus Nanohaloarchaea archaeon]
MVMEKEHPVLEHGLVYPVGNTHLSYYEDVSEIFEEEGAAIEDGHVMTVGADLVGWWLKDRYPGAEVTTVEVNPYAAYMQNFAGYQLENGRRPAEVKQLMGVEDSDNQLPGFLEEERVPRDVEEAHLDYVNDPETAFNQVPDFEMMRFANGDFYPEILDEIGSSARRPDRSVVEDVRDAGLPEVDVAFTNNVSDRMGRGSDIESFQQVMEDVLADDACLEMYSSTNREEVRHQLEESDGAFSDIRFNPDVDFWWVPGDYMDRDDPLVALAL